MRKVTLPWESSCLPPQVPVNTTLAYHRVRVERLPSHGAGKEELDIRRRLPEDVYLAQSLGRCERYNPSVVWGSSDVKPQP